MQHRAQRELRAKIPFATEREQPAIVPLEIQLEADRIDRDDAERAPPRPFDRAHDAEGRVHRL